MAALLKKQNPMARTRSAWCPGGRMATKAFVASPGHDLVDGQHRTAGAAQGGLVGARRHHRVLVDPD